MDSIIRLFDSILFFFFFAEIMYLFVFALFSLRKPQNDYPPARKQHRFLVLFPAYREDNVIASSIQSFLKQIYPKEAYKVVVISDQMKPETNQLLGELQVDVLQPPTALGSKAAALNYAIAHTPGEYNCVIILDADNQVEADFLQRINEVYDFGLYAIQAHRKAKNKNTDVAILDAVSEEINNSIFRKGHVNAGLSSGLIGSGMAFDYQWFADNIHKVSSAGEDKELELLLLSDGIYIEYMDDIIVYDEKIQSSSAYYQQRRRWVAAQFDILKKGFKQLPQAILSNNTNFCNKLLQWLFLPRIVLFGFSIAIAFLLSFFDWTLAVKWWVIWLLLVFALSIAMPDELYNKNFKRALRKTPALFGLMFINLFRTQGVNKKFIHTKHGEEKR